MSAGDQTGTGAGGGAGTADRAASMVAVAAACAILVISSSVLAGVLMRWLFNAPILAVDDLTDLNMAVAVACCLPAGLVGRHMVTIRFLGRALGRRTDGLLELLGAVLTFLFFVALAWQFGVLAANAAASGLGSMVLQIPQAPWWWVVTAVMALCVPFQGVVVIRAVRRVRGR
jgi:TRAP-type transport system small permease protein